MNTKQVECYLCNNTPGFRFCLTCCKDKPSATEFVFANGSRFMCDKCWLNWRCCGFWGRLKMYVIYGERSYNHLAL